MDGRKNNGGHSTKGVAGRKPKTEEQSLIEQMDAYIAPAKYWELLASKCAEGDTHCLKLWGAYRFGMPKQTIDNNITVQEPIVIDWTK
jgi:hypothetical protein